MRLGQADMTQIMGIGSYGEVRVGPDGRAYQWVEGVDGLGNPIGFWKKLRRVARGLRRLARRAMPLVSRIAPFVPGVGPAVAAGLRTATPYLRRAGVLGYDGLGALYQAPDGAVYRVDGVAQNEELRGLGQDELTQVMGIGHLGEVRTGPDGRPYQWVEGIDGLGNAIGFWKRLRRIGRGLRRLARRAMPIVAAAAPFVPGVGPAVAAGIRTGTPFLRRAGVVGVDGLGALYQADDGTVYQVQGLAQDEELRGLAEEEELRGLAEEGELRGVGEDDEVHGLNEDEELRGLSEEEDLRGLSEDEELRGLAEDEEMRGLEQGYVRESGVSGLDVFVPDQAAGRSSTSLAQPPEMWKPMW